MRAYNKIPDMRLLSGHAAKVHQKWAEKVLNFLIFGMRRECIRNVQGQAHRRRQYASTARRCNNAMDFLNMRRECIRNAQGQAHRRRQYASTARRCNNAMDISDVLVKTLSHPGELLHA